MCRWVCLGGRIAQPKQTHLYASIVHINFRQSLELIPLEATNIFTPNLCSEFSH